MYAYKLLRKRKDGSLGSLFIDRRARLPVGEWMTSRDHPTKGYAHRPGWHACCAPRAPHLTEKDRVWCAVELTGCNVMDRPASQGGKWVLAKRMKILQELTPEKVEVIRRQLDA